MPTICNALSGSALGPIGNCIARLSRPQWVQPTATRLCPPNVILKVTHTKGTADEGTKKEKGKREKDNMRLKQN